MMSRAGFELVLDSHRDKNLSDSFSERRSGLVHLRFAVADRTVLDRWAEHLDSVGVVRSPVKQGSTVALLTFHEAENIGLECYTLA